jgi:hypothetical protein
VVIGRNPSLAYEKCYELPTQPNLIHFKITLRQRRGHCAMPETQVPHTSDRTEEENKEGVNGPIIELV